MKTKSKLIIAISLVAVAVIGRFVPHLWNMTPLAAVAILAGARLGLGWGIAVPLVAMAITDPILGLAGLPIMSVIYLSFALSGVIGYLVRGSNRAKVIIGGSFLSTMLFFFTTNFAVWFFGTMYPHNFVGLMSSYVAGLPFLQNQIIGDLFFTASLFAVWELGGLLVTRLKLSGIKLLKKETI